MARRPLRLLRRASRPLVALSGLALIFVATTANAENIRVVSPTDFWFEFDTTTTFTARTYDAENSWADPMLWFYNSDGQLLVQNDDWFGLQSNIVIEVQSGWYRLRAGVCCGDPDAWRDGMVYDLYASSTQVVPTLPPSTTMPVWDSTTTTSTVPPISEPETTQSSPTSSTTTTTQPEETTTTSTTTTSTTMEPSTTTTATLLSPSTSLTLLPPTPTSESSSPSVTQSTTTTLVTTSTRPSTTTVIAPTNPPSTASTVAPTVLSSVPLSLSTTSTVGPVSGSTLVPQTPTEAVSVLSEGASPEQVAEAVAVIAENLDSLTVQELELISKTLSVAPPEVKREFESQVNIFSGGLDTYVPLDSTVTVGQRRVLVAVGAVMVAAPTVVRRK